MSNPARRCDNPKPHPPHDYDAPVSWGTAPFYCIGQARSRGGNPRAHLNGHYGHLGGKR